MIISDDNILKLVIAVVAFIGGKLWQHEGKLNKRVPYEHCTKLRENCPCIRELEDVKRRLEK